MLPTFSIVPCRWSPSWSLLTPAGVPVVIRSPVRKVRQLLEKADVFAQAADHVAGVRRSSTSLPFCKTVIERFCGSPISSRRHDPRTERGKRIEAFADVARVVHALAPRIALADVPAHHVAEDVSSA